MRSSKRPWKPPLFGTTRRRTRLYRSIYSKEQFNELIAFELANAQRSGLPLALIIFDVPDLKRTARRKRALISSLLESARTTDHLGDYDGQQIAALLPDTDREGAAQFVDKLGLDSRAAVNVRTLTYPGSWSEEIGDLPIDAGGNHSSTAAG